MKVRAESHQSSFLCFLFVLRQRVSLVALPVDVVVPPACYSRKINWQERGGREEREEDRKRERGREAIRTLETLKIQPLLSFYAGGLKQQNNKTGAR